MISEITIKNFKCFNEVNIKPKNLTVLSGINGMGKSSFIQALLLLRQSMLSSSKTTGARLNGPLVSLGYADDVLHEGAKKTENIDFSFLDEDAKLDFSYSYVTGSRILPKLTIPEHKTTSSLFNENFFYLKAERIGPRISNEYGDIDKEFYNAIGNAGEHCASLLALNERKPINNVALLHERDNLNELRAQVEAWLSEIGQHLRIHISEHKAMDQIGIQFSFIHDEIPSGNYRPTNVGFGITYALPIFVAALTIKSGGILFIENPEAHLHPKGQSAMGKFLSQVAESGIQVFIETHSDHLLNGIRIAAKRGLIKPDNVSLNFFHRDITTHATTVSTPSLDKNGRLDHWPEGFFDEWENGLSELL